MSEGMGLTDILKKAQELQERLSRMQQDAAARTVEASSGGGMVKAVMNGKLELISLTIDAAAIAGGDREMLQDLVIAAVNQAIRNAQAQMSEEMQKLTGGMKIPGLTP